MQLCGRAGRGGCSSRAHLFYSPRQKNVDEDIKKFCTGKENCRRVNLVRSMGSQETVHSSMPSACCDVCSGIPDLLSLQPKSETVSRQKRRSAQRHIDNDLEKELKQILLEERNAYMQEHPHYSMIGSDFICSKAAIDDICKNARFITSEENLTTTFDMRPEIQKRFFAAIKDILFKAPPSKKTRKVKHCTLILE